jgi:hypothetical protein
VLGIASSRRGRRPVAHLEPAALGVYSELNARVTELALHAGGALALLEAKVWRRPCGVK